MEINKERRDAILKLRQEGKTYGQICKELNCTKSIVAFYCNPNRYDSIEKDKKNDNKRQDDCINESKQNNAENKT